MSDTSYAGQRDITSDTSRYNATAFLVRMLLGNVATATLVVVKAVYPAGLGALGPVSSSVPGSVGTVEVQPMVNQIDAQGNSTPHGTVYNIPYFRLQGGKNAIVIDPVVGDIGMAAFASRDVSSVKATLEPSNPGSRRRFDYADGMYFGGLLNGLPTQFIEYLTDSDGNPAGINIQSAGGDVTINGVTIDLSGNVKSPAEITATNNDGQTVGLTTHSQSGVEPGGGDSGRPVGNT